MCGLPCKFKAGDLAIRSLTETYYHFPVSDRRIKIVEIVSPKCLFSYKDNIPVVKDHDFICKNINDTTRDFFPVVSDRLKKIENPNTILKGMISKEANMTVKENFNDFKQSVNKNEIKNRLKEKKRLEKERKKNGTKEQKSS